MSQPLIAQVCSFEALKFAAKFLLLGVTFVLSTAAFDSHATVYQLGTASCGVAIGEIPLPNQIDNSTPQKFCPDLNKSPMEADTTSTLYEDSTAYLLFDFIDANNSSFDSIKITQLETAGDLRLNGLEVTLNQIILASDINALTFTPTADENGINYANFKFKVNNGTNEYTFTFHVIPVNDAPSFTKGANQIIYLGADIEQTVKGWATNINKGATNENAQSLKFDVDFWNTDIFSMKPAINTNGTLTYTLSGKLDVATVEVKLQDDGGIAYGGIDKSNTQLFTITVEKLPITVSISEFASNSDITGTVSVPKKVTSDLVVYLSSNNCIVAEPNTVTIPAGQNSATFTITCNSDIDNIQTPIINATYKLPNVVTEVCNIVTEISQLECESLLQLYHSTNGSNNWRSNYGWNNTNKPCRWEGITCKNNSVVEISFYDNQLTGPIPDFSGLPNLERLKLKDNQLTGPIPDFSGLLNLESLHLSKNQLTGPIPDFSGLPNLYRLSLQDNQLTGPIPDFSGLPNLEWLSLQNNQLTGPIPDFSVLPNLEWLSLQNNQLTGPIPDFNLPNLLDLYLDNNQLTGPIPDFSWLPNLRYFYLSNNQLTGPIPDFRGLSVWSINIEGNQLTTVQVILKKENYRPGEHFKAELTETFSNSYDLYVAVVLPNGTDFIALENTNQFAPLNQPQKWLASRVQNEKPITLLDLTLSADLAMGKYCLYGILSPKDELVLEKVEQWVMERQCFKILPN